MKFEEAHSFLGGIPFISPERAHTLYDFVLHRKPVELLELGIGHGVSSCYMAAALDEIGNGHVTSVDLVEAEQWFTPTIDQLLARTNLNRYVTVVREATSYTWFLKKQIEARTINNVCRPNYDFCFIDGPKNWTIDGCAFFLVDKLLKGDGWILFDDYMWSYAKSNRDATDGISHRHMSEDELNSPHIELIFRLLVMQHPDYSEFKLQDQWWAWAHKTLDRGNIRKSLVIDQTYSYKVLFLNGLRKIGVVRK